MPDLSCEMQKLFTHNFLFQSVSCIYEVHDFLRARVGWLINMYSRPGGAKQIRATYCMTFPMLVIGDSLAKLEAPCCITILFQYHLFSLVTRNSLANIGAPSTRLGKNSTKAFPTYALIKLAHAQSL